MSSALIKTQQLKLTTVDFLMSLEQVLLNEAHVTLTATKRPLPCRDNSHTMFKRPTMLKQLAGFIRGSLGFVHYSSTFLKKYFGKIN